MEKDIKATDLMIGNWFSYTNENGTFYLQVEEIRPSGIVTTWNNGEWFVAFDKVKGIPLTEDILLKCGFEVDESDAGTFYRLNGVEIEVYTYGRGDTLYFGLEILDQNGFENSTVNSLHQLQNLFKSLTQTDLNVKL